MVLGCPVLAPIAVAHKVRTRLASAYVAMLAIWLIYIFYLYGARPNWEIRWALLALPVLVAVVAHLGLVEPVVRAMPHGRRGTGVAGAYRHRPEPADQPAHLGRRRRGRGLAAVVALIWRMAKGVQQDDRQYGLDNGPGRRPGGAGPGRPGPDR